MSKISLSNKAYKTVKEKILFETNKHRHLSVRQIARDLDMSYTPVREAFKRLESEGLLDRIPNVGYLIPQISNRNIEEIFQARECLETFVFRKVFPSLNEDIIKKLEEYTDKQKEALKMEDITEFYDSDKKFHMIFFEIYNNTHLTEMIKNIRERYLLCSLSTVTGNNNGISQAIKEHIEIVENIKKGDKEAALECLIKNIKNSQTRLEKGNISIH